MGSIYAFKALAYKSPQILTDMDTEGYVVSLNALMTQALQAGLGSC